MGPVPAYIPTSAHDVPPDFRHITKSASDLNLKRLRKYTLLDDPAGLIPSGSGNITVSVSNGGLAGSKSVTASIAQQEKEFQKAVQPGSPISALLSSARQPLVMGNGPTTAGGNVRDSPLVRKLQSVKESPLGRRTVTRGLDGIVEEHGGVRRRITEDDEEEEENRLRKKELEAQKARIVAQMAPVREEGEEEAHLDPDEEEEREMRRLEKERAARKARAAASAPAPVPAAATRTKAPVDRENVAPMTRTASSGPYSRPAKHDGHNIGQFLLHD